MARGRKPVGKKAMSGAERQRHSRERKAYEAGTIKKAISRATRAQIRQYRIAKINRDLVDAEKAARLLYGWHPLRRDLKRLQARLIELRRLAAGFRHRPSTYYTQALFSSDPEAKYCVYQEVPHEWRKLHGLANKLAKLPPPQPTDWIPPEWVAIAEEDDELAARYPHLTREEREELAYKIGREAVLEALIGRSDGPPPA
jgi:hypothetical protein